MGFGFGAIQAGLFLFEAFFSVSFKRLVVAEVASDVVSAIRGSGGYYNVNVAFKDGIRNFSIGPIEILNPTISNDRELLIKAIADADEVATALPSVAFYGNGEETSPALIITEGLALRKQLGVEHPMIIYTAENHNHAAEILMEKLEGLSKAKKAKLPHNFQVLNTVIGKMSGVVNDEEQIREQALQVMAPGLKRCFLVEAFNRILITKITLTNFERGIKVFEEKENLLPFEEAKLYGHNATHALIGYLAYLKGVKYMADVADDEEIMRLARKAFIEESGAALVRKYQGIDRLFTEQGYYEYARDLLERMMNKHLRDAVARVVRDPARKLAWEDRLIGTMRLALAYGIKPVCYAKGAAAALEMLKRTENLKSSDEEILLSLWKDALVNDDEKMQIIKFIKEASI